MNEDKKKKTKKNKKKKKKCNKIRYVHKKQRQNTCQHVFKNCFKKLMSKHIYIYIYIYSNIIPRNRISMRWHGGLKALPLKIR